MSSSPPRWTRGIRAAAIAGWVTLTAAPAGAAVEMLDTARAAAGNASSVCERRRVCVGVRVTVLEDASGPAASREWFDERLAQANRLFEVIDVGFTVTAWTPRQVESAAVDTRGQRDAVGAGRPHEGQVDVYLSSRLMDVDAPGTQIRGVHWRLRRDTSQRWIVMSAISGPMVLAHELGHFFSLPHGTERASIMNKRPRPSPPWAERVFTAREQARMRAAMERMLADRRLVPVGADRR